MKSIACEFLRDELTKVRKSVARGQRWIVTFHGKSTFAIVPMADLEKIQQAEAKRSKPDRR